MENTCKNCRFVEEVCYLNLEAMNGDKKIQKVVNKFLAELENKKIDYIIDLENDHMHKRIIIEIPF
jgi:hypothetical protein